MTASTLCLVPPVRRWMSCCDSCCHSRCNATSNWQMFCTGDSPACIIVLFELWRSILKMDMFYCKNWSCDIVIKYSLNWTFFLIFFVVSYSQCNVLTGDHCVLEIIWSVISWYLYHLWFQKNMGVLNFFLCVYKKITVKKYRLTKTDRATKT
jgi:hypothetical protein